jgi:hypothetical protein
MRGCPTTWPSRLKLNRTEICRGNLARVGNRILRRRAMPCGIDRHARTRDGNREAHYCQDRHAPTCHRRMVMPRLSNRRRVTPRPPRAGGSASDILWRRPASATRPCRYSRSRLPSRGSRRRRAHNNSTAGLRAVGAERPFGLLDRHRGRQVNISSYKVDSTAMSTTIPNNCRQLSSCGHSWPEAEAMTARVSAWLLSGAHSP